MTALFKIRPNGSLALAPLLGEFQPTMPERITAWPAEPGDLRDMRNRLGQLVPSSQRFLEIELVREPPQPSKEPSAVLTRLQEINRKRKQETGSNYRDPFQRDTAEAPGPVCYCPPLPQERDLYDPLFRRRARREQRLADFLQETSSGALRREAWRPGPTTTCRTPAEVYWDLGPGRKPGRTSQRLSQPKPKKKAAGEWANFSEMMNAEYRRRSLDRKMLRKLKVHADHGEFVRVKKLDLEGEKLSRLLIQLKAKERKPSYDQRETSADSHKVLKSPRVTFANGRSGPAWIWQSPGQSRRSSSF